MNLDRWAYTMDANTPPWAMDVRHIDMIAAVVRLNGLQSAVEIGCLNGRSTTAFVEAVEAGAELRWLGLCDVEPTAALHRVIAEKPSRLWIDLVACARSKMPPWSAALWLIDGNHEYAFVRDDVAHARSHCAQILVLHDTDHHAVDGPRRVLAEIRDQFPVVFHDNAQRPGEETERGIAFLFIEDSPATAACVAALQQLAK